MDVRQLRTLFSLFLRKQSRWRPAGCSLDGLGRSVVVELQPRPSLSLSRKLAHLLCLPFGMVATIDFLSLSSVSSHLLYRVGLLVAHLDRVEFDFYVPSSCSAPQPILPNFQLQVVVECPKSMSATTVLVKWGGVLEIPVRPPPATASKSDCLISLIDFKSHE